MKHGLWHKRIPTVFALVVLLGSIWVTSLLIQSGVIYVGRASPDKVPQNVKISNITDSSFTVTFTTNNKTAAALSVEEIGKNPYVVFDDRNKKANNQEPFYSHYITVSDLDAETNYKFSILSDGETYLLNGENYSVKTGPKIETPPLSQNPIFGKAILPDGQTASDTIVELKISGAQTISTLTKNNGEYTIPTNAIRTIGLDKYFAIPLTQEVELIFLRQDLKSSVKIKFENASNVPTTTLEKQYDFTQTSKPIDESTPSSQLKTPSSQVGFGQVTITAPSQNQSFIDSRPLFRGTGLANKSVKITIDSNKTIPTLTTSSSGVWTYRPDNPLSAGEHSITIETPDRFGITQTLSRSFAVFPSGSQVSDTATPSATPTGTRTPTPSPTLTPTLIPSVSPTIALTPSVSPTVIPTFTPTPIASLTPTLIPTTVAKPTITPTNIPLVTPAPTGSMSTIILTSISILLIVAGGALLFLL